MNSADKYGFTLAHYFAYFNLMRCLKFGLAKGAELSVKAKGGVKPLHIALCCNHSEMARFIIDHSEEISLNQGANLGSGSIDFKTIKENKDRVEKFLRKITLNESLSNSEVSKHPSVEIRDCHDPHDSSGEHSESELMKSLYTLLTDQVAHSTQAPQLMTGSERRDFITRRKRLRHREQQIKLKKTNEEMEEDHLLNQQIHFSGSQEQVKLIQKNVRGWLRRRQFNDTKFAVKILQTRKLWL